jgi:hypothetical protein
MIRYGLVLAALVATILLPGQVLGASGVYPIPVTCGTPPYCLVPPPHGCAITGSSNCKIIARVMREIEHKEDVWSHHKRWIVPAPQCLVLRLNPDGSVTAMCPSVHGHPIERTR